MTKEPESGTPRTDELTARHLHESADRSPNMFREIRHGREWVDLARSLERELAAALAERDEARKDAERYRFLRELQGDFHVEQWTRHLTTTGRESRRATWLVKRGSDLDAAIDAALTAERGGRSGG